MYPCEQKISSNKSQVIRMFFGNIVLPDLHVHCVRFQLSEGFEVTKNTKIRLKNLILYTRKLSISFENRKNSPGIYV